MINTHPDFSGLVRVGKTNISPEVKAQELSLNKNIATPYILIYKKYFDNCIVAEHLIHNALSSYATYYFNDIEDKHEHFKIDTTTAIDVIVNTDITTVDPTYLAKRYRRYGDDYYYELKDYIPHDTEEALYYYQRAAELGEYEVYATIGDIYELNDINMAIEAYKTAYELGNKLHSMDLALIYSKPFCKDEQEERKWWNLFFTAADQILYNTPNQSNKVDTLLHIGILKFYLLHHNDSFWKEKYHIIKQHKETLIEIYKDILILGMYPPDVVEGVKSLIASLKNI